MKIAIMQPYFFPYIGYFQLMNAVDEFVIYDNIEFTKKGWINRNRILVNGADSFISLPLKKDSDYLHVKDRYLAESWEADKKKLLNRIRESYRKAPFYNKVFPLFEMAINYEDRNLFNFIFHSISLVNEYLGIKTKLILSSTLPIDHQLKSDEKVIAICKALGAEVYINPVGGIGLYNKEKFKNEGIELLFHKVGPFTYSQFNNNFIPWLSIMDVLMFNNLEDIIILINREYALL